MTDSPLAVKLAALRREFDDSFATPPSERAEESEQLLLIRSGGESLALKIGELAGLVKDRTILPLPETPPELLGIAGIRGRLVPVYSLARLLGGSPQDNERWLVLCEAGGLTGLTFSAFEGYAKVSRADLSPNQEHGSARGALVRIGAESRGVVSVGAVVAVIRARATAVMQTKPEQGSGDRID
jgi:purine-binding chemotaxis protein CheW